MNDAVIKTRTLVNGEEMLRIKFSPESQPTPVTLRSWRKNFGFPCHKIGRLCFYSLDEVDTWLDKRRTGRGRK